jgi:hypothetical protein
MNRILLAGQIGDKLNADISLGLSQLYGASEFAALAMGSADFTLISQSTKIGP